MNKLLFLGIAMLAATPLLATPVHVKTAQEIAQRFVMERDYSGMLRAPISGQVTLAHTELNSQKADLAAFYVFNTANGYVIVSGDDRAEAILAYGDQPFDINRIPGNMRAWLGTYKEQLEYLQAHPGMIVETQSMMAPSLRTASVAPLLTAMWDQEAPYWNQCRINYSQCLTGCPATSAAMVFHYWKCPDFETDPVPAYQYYSGSTITVPALPAVTFDWDNMLDKYTNGYTTEQATAVATLMRYVGQAEHMEYGTQSSGVHVDSAYLIADAFKFFGYDQETVRLVKKTSAYSGGYTIYSDSQWAAMIQQELAERRPIVFCAVSNSGGHAFNIDGYDSSTNKYHINWGWSGSYNDYFALNAFTCNGMTFKQYQQMVIGIQPGPAIPRLKVSDQAINMECFIGQTASSTFTLKGNNLEGDATLTLTDPEGVFSLDETTLSMDNAKEGRTFTVTYAPKAEMAYSAAITICSPGAEAVTVELTGMSSYELYIPEMLPTDEETITTTSFCAKWNDNTPIQNVVSYSLEVMPKPASMLLDEADFSEVPKETANHASDAVDYLPDGWTFEGSYFYLDGGFISASRNSIITANFNLMDYDKVSVIVKAKNYPKVANTTLDISTSEQIQRVTLTADVATYLVVLDAGEDGQVKFTCGYYPEIQSIKIYGGLIEDAEPYALRAPSLRTDDDVLLIEGISPELTTYNVTGLTPGQTYFYHLKAIYVNDTESAWSRFQEVILPMQSLVIGDVDGDGVVGIADVAALIDYILNGGVAGINEQAADVDQNGEINIADASELIDYLLNGER